MKTLVLAILATAMLALALVSAAFAASALPASAGDTLQAIQSAAVGAVLQQPGTTQAGGIGNLPSTSTETVTLAGAVGAIVAMFVLVALAARAALLRR